MNKYAVFHVSKAGFGEYFYVGLKDKDLSFAIEIFPMKDFVKAKAYCDSLNNVPVVIQVYP